VSVLFLLYSLRMNFTESCGGIYYVDIAFAWSTHDNAKLLSEITKWHPTIATDGDDLKRQCCDIHFKMSPIKIQYIPMFICIVVCRIALSLCVRIVAMSIRAVVCRPCKYGCDIINRHAIISNDKRYLCGLHWCRIHSFIYFQNFPTRRKFTCKWL
jgi:hypothetical protein